MRARDIVAAALGLLLGAAGGCARLEDEEGVHALTGGTPARGRRLVDAYGCGTCHQVPGVPGARGSVGPPLAGVARRSILAGRIQNSPGNMTQWVQHPQKLVPGTLMPELGVTDDDARDIAAYLSMLQ
jgi:cytochrome c